MDLNTVYTENAGNSNWRIIIPRMNRMDSNLAYGIYYPSLWINSWYRGLRSHTMDLNPGLVITYPPVGSVCTHKSSCELNLYSQIPVCSHKSVYRLRNPCIGWQIHVWAQQSMYGLSNTCAGSPIYQSLAAFSWSWRLGLDISHFVIIIYSL